MGECAVRRYWIDVFRGRVASICPGKGEATVVGFVCVSLK